MRKAKGKVLIVDDDQTIQDSLSFLLKYEFESIHGIKNPNRIPEAMGSIRPDVILLDMNFKAGIQSGNEGIYWLNSILEQDADAVIILITAYGDIELAVKAIKMGATDFIHKPWDSEKLISTLKAACKLRTAKYEVNTLKNQNQVLREEAEKDFNILIGKSQVMQKVLRDVDKVAKTDANVLILGENGTGKELIAREIHRQSERSEKIFTSIDMTSISEGLFEAEIFGYTKGAFTDAHTDRIGRIENSSGGTLFLDEIGNLNMTIQSKILSVLQSRKIVRLGSNIENPVDIRLISATNKDLPEMIKAGLFRKDLLYRINTVLVELPPLREREKDIQILADYFLDKYKKKYNKSDLSFSKEATNGLYNYEWPGNVRELMHTMERIVILKEGNRIESEDLMPAGSKSGSSDDINILNLEELEKRAVLKALEKHSMHLSNTAIELGISRPTLYSKIKKYDL